jgi:hypothetical protein
MNSGIKESKHPKTWELEKMLENPSSEENEIK